MALSKRSRTPRDRSPSEGRERYVSGTVLRNPKRQGTDIPPVKFQLDRKEQRRWSVDYITEFESTSSELSWRYQLVGYICLGRL